MKITHIENIKRFQNEINVAFCAVLVHLSEDYRYSRYCDVSDLL